MEIPFVKMHGAGNDFIMIDARKMRLPSPELLRTIANRPDGVGCEGVIFITEPKRINCAFAMRFFNPDGSEADFCGNGARCVAAFAKKIEAVKPELNHFTFETRAGDIEADVSFYHSHGTVKISMPQPRDLKKNFINTGVPHAIMPVKDLDKAPVDEEGRRIRYSDKYAPQGTNVDFVHYTLPSRVDIRTYERGVEAETFACGSGAVAAALVGVAQYGLEFPVTVVTARNVELIVDAYYSDGEFSSLSLEGPVKTVFSGVLYL